MKLVEFHQRSPIGGHHFLESDGTLIRADTKDALLVQIHDHRLRNGLHVGSPEHDVAMFYYVHAPWWAEKGVPKPIADPLEVKALDWLNKLRGSPMPIVMKQDALVRAKVCLSCPHHKSLSESLESAELRRRAMMLTGGIVPPMGVCTHHQWHCGVACAAKEPVGKWPVAGCWAS